MIISPSLHFTYSLGILDIYDYAEFALHRSIIDEAHATYFDESGERHGIMCGEKRLFCWWLKNRASADQGQIEWPKSDILSKSICINHAVRKGVEEQGLPQEVPSQV